MEMIDILRKAEKRLQKLSASGSSEDSNVRKNVQAFKTSLLSFGGCNRCTLNNYSSKQRQRLDMKLVLALRSKGHDGPDLEMNEKKASFLDDDISDVGFSELQMTTGQKNKQLTAEREREIRQVLKSINELAQIMMDLSVTQS